MAGKCAIQNGSASITEIEVVWPIFLVLPGMWGYNERNLSKSNTNDESVRSTDVSDQKVGGVLMKKVLVSCLFFALWPYVNVSSLWAIDVGWMQQGVRVWYFGAVGTGGTSDAEEAYLFTSINGNTAQLTHHSGVNHWSTPSAVAETGSTVGEGPFWIHPQVLQTIAVGDTWRGIKIYTKNQGTYTYDTFKATSELSSLPYLLLPIKALFDLKPQRELIRLVYGNPNYPNFDPVTGTAYFDAETGLRLFVTQMAAYVTTFFILSEINYDFAAQTAFAEDNGPHTGFGSTVLKTKSATYASHFVQMLSSVESRYGGTVQMWTATQAGGAINAYFGRNENYGFFGSVPVLRHKLMSTTPQYPPENWSAYGEYLWWWVPTDALQKSTINVFSVPMTRTSTAPYTFTATGTQAGLYFSKLIFDNDGYITDFSAKDPSIGLDLDLGSLVDEDTTVNGLTYYKNTMGRATPAELPHIDLAGGWNFVSFTALPAVSTPVETVLRDISPNVQVVWGYNNQNKTWQKWVRGGGSNTLTTIESVKGYWIYMGSQGSIYTTGWTPPASTSVSLYDGWNLIGYLGTDNTATGTALASQNGKWVTAWTWNSGQWSCASALSIVLPAPIQQLSTFRQGKAYWLRITGGGSTWVQ